MTPIIRQINLAKVFQAICREKPSLFLTSAKSPSSHLSTVKDVIDELTDYGLVRLTGLESSLGADPVCLWT